MGMVSLAVKNTCVFSLKNASRYYRTLVEATRASRGTSARLALLAVNWSLHSPSGHNCQHKICRTPDARFARSFQAGPATTI